MVGVDIRMYIMNVTYPTMREIDVIAWSWKMINAFIVGDVAS